MPTLVDDLLPKFSFFLWKGVLKEEGVRVMLLQMGQIALQAGVGVAPGQPGQQSLCQLLHHQPRGGVVVRLHIEEDMSVIGVTATSESHLENLCVTW